MSDPAPLRIDAIVADTERPALEAAAGQLRECLAAAAGRPWPVALRWCTALADVAAHDRPEVVVASLLPELERTALPLAEIEARWRAQLAALAGTPPPPVLICTIFRHVADRADAGRADGREATRERLRRLNLLAVDLSHDTGAGVVDIDRVFAHLGARALATDHRLVGRAAAEVAGYAIVAGILGLDVVVAPEFQEGALQFQGPLWDVGQLVLRRHGPPD